MRLSHLFTLLSFAILIIAGCSTTTTKNSVPDNKPVTAASPKAAPSKPETSQPATADLPKSDLKPDKIDLEKPFDATDLRNAAMADLESWKGKVVTAVGNGDGSTVSTLRDGNKSTNMKFKNDHSEIVISCTGPKPPPSDLLSNNKGRIFKGTVKGILTEYKQLELENCEVIN